MAVPLLLLECVLLLLLLLCVCSRFLGRGRGQTTTVLRFVIILLLGMLKITFDTTLVSPDNISRFIRAGSTVQIQGTLTDMPVVRNGVVRWVVEAETVIVYGRPYRASGGVVASAPTGHLIATVLDSLEYGRHVLMQGELIDPGAARNPGEFSPKAGTGLP